MMTSCLCPGSQIGRAQTKNKKKKKKKGMNLCGNYQKRESVGEHKWEHERTQDSQMSVCLSLTVIGIQILLLICLSFDTKW